MRRTCLCFVAIIFFVSLTACEGPRGPIGYQGNPGNPGRDGRDGTLPFPEACASLALTVIVLFYARAMLQHYSRRRFVKFNPVSIRYIRNNNE